MPPKRRRPQARSRKPANAKRKTAAAAATETAAPAEANATETNAPRPIEIPRVLTVKELGDLMELPPTSVIKELMKNGVMAAINQSIDFETAAIVAHDLGFEPEEAAPKERAEISQMGQTGAVIEEEGVELQPRPPVVTVLGHVDHGKTSLLDAIRKTNVIGGEAGGITQHIGAYQVKANGQSITFLDTPGHAAFTAMRARGARITDIVVLVVAADDGVMPQTKEAIDHARAAGVPIVVAITKIDLPGAQPDRVKQQLAEQEINIEEYGGDVICVSASAKTGEGMTELLENILVAAEILELRANPDRAAIGTVIEAGMDRTRGPNATVLVQTGTLRVGDVAVVGETSGRIKAMFDEDGGKLKAVGPGEPAAILGLRDVPRAGDVVTVVKDEKTARQIVVRRAREKQAASLHVRPRVTLDTLFGEISAGKVKELNLILKTDVQGSIEPIRQSLEHLSTDKVRVKIIHSGTGTINEQDVMLAMASGGIIIAFNTRPEPGAERLIAQENVDLRNYDVIYNITEDVENALKGMLDPVYKDVISGHVEVREVFQVRRRAQVAGAYVLDGAITRGDLVRVIRDDEQIADTTIASLRRFQEDVREVRTGFECGVVLENFTDFKQGDLLELYHSERET